MSTIWTPSGERPIRSEPEPESAPSAPPGAQRAPTEEEVMAEMRAVQQQLLETPAAVVVTNHCIGLFQLAALHLEQNPPKLAEAKVAIDAMGAMVETLGPRLGQEEQPLRDALSQLRLAYVQRQGAAGST
ncbi:MAG: DUF1844 domain-containing protein, partial [Actinomycetota bacterium]|nr:DUF1844 domain-containing protein [Actinomycetota bacterium]